MTKDYNEQVNFIVKKFQENQKSIEDQDKIIAEIQAKYALVIEESVFLRNRGDFFEDHVESIRTEFSSLLSNLEKKRADEKALLESSIEITKNSVVDLALCINKLNNEVKSLLDSLRSSELSLSRLNGSIGNLSKEVVATNAKVDLLQSEWQIKFNGISDIQKEINLKINKITSFEDALTKSQAEIKSNTALIWNLSGRQVEYEKTFENKNNTLRFDLEEKIVEKIESVPKPVTPSLDQVATSVRGIIEPCALDAKNANLRASNNESKLSLLEKKVEQLQLLLNQMKLQGNQ